MKEGLPITPEDPAVYLKTNEGQHYSDKGSHKQRSDFWKGLRRSMHVSADIFIAKTDAYTIDGHSQEITRRRSPHF